MKLWLAIILLMTPLAALTQDSVVDKAEQLRVKVYMVTMTILSEALAKNLG